MDFLPAFLDLRGRRVVVIGGGSVALRKIAMLMRVGARLTVVAPSLHSELQSLAQAGTLTWLRTEFEAQHLDGAMLAVAATNNRAVNAAVAAAGAQRNLFVNAVDDLAACSMTMPAIVDRSPLLVAIGTSGNTPSLARRVRSQIEALLPEGLGRVAATAGRWRARVAVTLPDLAERRRFWDRVLTSSLPHDVAAGAAADAAADVALGAQLQAHVAESRDGKQRLGEVWLIGAGPGAADLLTLRALQLLQECDVVLYDRLVSAAVLERVRRDAERVFVGKESGAHRTTQARIHELLIAYARRGLRVARLKGGDPLVFGRGGEELAALAAAGIPVTIVPGITAALGAAAVAGIPLTHRGVAQAVTLVTAMGEAAGALDWRSLAAPLQTTVFYMGVAQLPRIVERLIANGAPPTRPVAIVENATLAEQFVLVGTIADIAARASTQGTRAPALLIVGDVVGHAMHVKLA